MEYVIDSILFFIFYFFGLWVRHHFSVCDHFCKALVSTNLMHIIIKHVCIYKYLPIVLIFFNSKTVHLNFFVFLFFCCCFFCGSHIRLDGFRLYSNSVEIWCLKVLARQVEKCCWWINYCCGLKEWITISTSWQLWWKSVCYPLVKLLVFFLVRFSNFFQMRPGLIGGEGREGRGAASGSSCSNCKQGRVWKMRGGRRIVRRCHAWLWYCLTVGPLCFTDLLACLVVFQAENRSLCRL